MVKPWIVCRYFYTRSICCRFSTCRQISQFSSVILSPVQRELTSKFSNNHLLLALATAALSCHITTSGAPLFHFNSGPRFNIYSVPLLCCLSVPLGYLWNVYCSLPKMFQFQTNVVLCVVTWWNNNNFLFTSPQEFWPKTDICFLPYHGIWKKRPFKWNLHTACLRQPQPTLKVQLKMWKHCSVVVQ